MTERGQSIATTKADVMEWVETQLAQEVRLREQVEVRRNELRLEQQFATLREARGLSQRQVAQLVGVSQPAIAKLESATVRNLQLKTLIRVLTALGGRLEVEVVPPSRAQGGSPRSGALAAAFASPLS
jgi:predicted XRE-type DNA-binding protein